MLLIKSWVALVLMICVHSEEPQPPSIAAKLPPNTGKSSYPGYSYPYPGYLPYLYHTYPSQPPAPTHTKEEEMLKKLVCFLAPELCKSGGSKDTEEGEEEEESPLESEEKNKEDLAKQVVELEKELAHMKALLEPEEEPEEESPVEPEEESPVEPEEESPVEPEESPVEPEEESPVEPEEESTAEPEEESSLIDDIFDLFEPKEESPVEPIEESPLDPNEVILNLANQVEELIRRVEKLEGSKVENEV